MKPLKTLIQLFAAASLLAAADMALAANPAINGGNPAGLQDQALLRQLALDFLTQQAAAQPGQVQVTVGEVDKRLNLAACDSPTPYLPPGSKPWGKITIVIKCVAPTAWQIYLQANVQVTAEYYVATNPVVQGQVLTLADLTKVKGDISKLPAGVVTNPDQAVGKAMQVSIPSGSVLRVDAMKNPSVIQQGQSVRVISSGPGFQVMTDAIALNNASDGQVAKAKTSSGQTVSGLAKSGGIIEIVY
ncbi:flagellar basal body P-ring formation chaperone FlgA [Undibacterium sp. TJN19]|uniref:flagellar basal body P-ring formation chaperone FlgA n=1 Tax=Undibacterium sp. TJN19 TaxID=3413055 RepID=UPI003BF29563